jgi:hypothetical protein
LFSGGALGVHCPFKALTVKVCEQDWEYVLPHVSALVTAKAKVTVPVELMMNSALAPRPFAGVAPHPLADQVGVFADK